MKDKDEENLDYLYPLDEDIERCPVCSTLLIIKKEKKESNYHEEIGICKSCGYNESRIV